MFSRGTNLRTAPSCNEAFVYICPVYTIPQPSMSIRHAQHSDQPAMAQIATKAFIDDELFGELIHPHRKQYPEDVQMFWLKRLRKAWNKPYNHFLVSTIKAQDGSEIVTGMVRWSRKGKATDEIQAAEPKDDVTEESNEPVNRAADLSMLDILGRSYPFTPKLWEGMSTVSVPGGYLLTAARPSLRMLGSCPVGS